MSFCILVIWDSGLFIGKNIGSYHVLLQQMLKIFLIIEIVRISEDV